MNIEPVENAPENLAAVLRSWRHHEELTLSEASERVGLTIDTYRRVEHGKPMDGKTLRQLLRWLLA